jgi:hypothetical protein
MPDPQPWVDPTRARIAELSNESPMGPAVVASAEALLAAVADIELPEPDVVQTGPASGLRLAWRHGLRHLVVDFEPDGTASYGRWRVEYRAVEPPEDPPRYAWQRAAEESGPLPPDDVAGARLVAAWLVL